MKYIYTLLIFILSGSAAFSQVEVPGNSDYADSVAAAWVLTDTVPGLKYTIPLDGKYPPRSILIKEDLYFQKMNYRSQTSFIRAYIYTWIELFVIIVLSVIIIIQYRKITRLKRKGV